MPNNEGVLSTTFLMRRERWKRLLPDPIRRIARRTKKLGRHLFGIREVQWCRVIMDRETDRFVRGLQYSTLDALEIAGNGSGKILVSGLIAR